MQKTMIYLPEEVHRRLRYLALDNRTSMAELIRNAIDRYLETQPQPAVRRPQVAGRKGVRHAR